MASRKAWAAGLWLTGNAGDIALTHTGLALGCSEGNPLVSEAIAKFGAGWTYTCKAAVAVVLLIFIDRFARKHPSIWTYLQLWNIVLFGVLVWNLRIVAR